MKISQRLHALHPQAAADLALANIAAWEATDPALLELCRCLIVTILELDSHFPSSRSGWERLSPDKSAAIAKWASSNEFAPLERAALEFTEQFVLSVSTMSDKQVEGLRLYLNDEALYAFAAALYVIEMTERLQVVALNVIAKEA